MKMNIPALPQHIVRMPTKTARILSRALLIDDSNHNKIQRDANLLVTSGLASYRFIRIMLAKEGFGTIWCIGHTDLGIAVSVENDIVRMHTGRIL